VGLLQRTGEVVSRRRANVQQATIAPRRRRTIAPGAVVDSEAEDSYARLPAWGDPQQTGWHAAGAFARDDEGEGFCAGPGHPRAGFWSGLRSWLRPHRGSAQETLPISVRCFAFVHHVRRRGKA